MSKAVLNQVAPRPTMNKVEMLAEAKALEELYDKGFYTDEELEAEKNALKVKYGVPAAVKKPGKGKAKK